jgi:hypothetical protein
METSVKILDKIPSNGMFIALEIKGAAVIKWQVKDTNFLTDEGIKQFIVNKMVDDIALSDEIDAQLMGEDGFNIYNIKRTLPNRQFRLHIIVDGEIMTSGISTRLFPTGVLHNYKRLKGIFATCLSTVSSDPLDVSKLEQPKKEGKKGTKKPKTAVELEQLEADRLARFEAKKAFIAQEKAEALEYRKAKFHLN